MMLKWWCDVQRLHISDFPALNNVSDQVQTLAYKLHLYINYINIISISDTDYYLTSRHLGHRNVQRPLTFIPRLKTVADIGQSAKYRVLPLYGAICHHSAMCDGDLLCSDCMFSVSYTHLTLPTNREV